MNLFSRPHAATSFLLVLNLIDFAMLVLIEGRLPIGFLGSPASRLGLIGVGAVSPALALAQPWRLLSATFVHSGALHLVMNMYALKSFSAQTEQHVGGPRSVIIYVLTGVFGFVVSSVWYGASGPLTVGASGAIFGLIGAEVGRLWRRRDPAAKDVFIQNLVMALALALLFPVNNAAHFGGFVAGAGLGALLAKEPRSLRAGVLVPAFAGLCAAASVLSVVLALVTLYVIQR